MPVNIIKLLADSNSAHKLKYKGVTFVVEYLLRNMEIDTVKPDIHIKQILVYDKSNSVSFKSDCAIMKKRWQLFIFIEIS